MPPWLMAHGGMSPLRCFTNETHAEKLHSGLTVAIHHSLLHEVSTAGVQDCEAPAAVFVLVI